MDNSMDTAPRDGTRILALCAERHFVKYRGWETVGYTIHEIWWTHKFSSEEPMWCMWCGDGRTHSTSTPKPVAWVPVPDALKVENVKWQTTS